MKKHNAVAVDWYSFTIPSDHLDTDEQRVIDTYSRTMEYVLSELTFNALLGGKGWEKRNGRRPYKYGLTNGDVFVWYGGQTTVLCEISGNGCARLRATDVESGNALTEIISATHERATRLDFAVDIETETRPKTFVGHGYNKRIKSRAEMVSRTGETVYIGSKKGDRYCRIYRYDNEHNRAHLLRIETVSKQGYAKQSAKFLAYYRVQDVAQMTLNYFKFQSPEIVGVSDMTEVIKLPEKNTSDYKRVKWLKEQVSPAVVDLLQRGVITKEQLLEMFHVDSIQERMF